MSLYIHYTNLIITIIITKKAEEKKKKKKEQKNCNHEVQHTEFYTLTAFHKIYCTHICAIFSVNAAVTRSLVHCRISFSRFSFFYYYFICFVCFICGAFFSSVRAASIRVQLSYESIFQFAQQQHHTASSQCSKRLRNGCRRTFQRDTQ